MCRRSLLEVQDLLQMILHVFDLLPCLGPIAYNLMLEHLSCGVYSADVLIYVSIIVTVHDLQVCTIEDCNHVAAQSHYLTACIAF